MRYIIYADIHHDHFAAKCIRIEDTIEIERYILQRAAEKEFDFTIFAGDRFLAREPKDEVKTKADAVFFEHYPTGVPHYHLIGNHDWVNNSMNWHTSYSLAPLPNVCLLDSSESVYPRGEDYVIHALPSGYKMDMSAYTPVPTRLNIFIFHDIVMGSYMRDQDDAFFREGISLGEIDRPEFDVVYGGDIHVPQVFNMQNVPFGGYVGATVQRNRGEAGQKRGWLEVDAQLIDGKWQLEHRFMRTRDFFIRREIHVDDTSQFDGLDVEDWDFQNKHVEIRLVGTPENVDRVAADPKWKNISTFYTPRSLEVMRMYETDRVSPTMSVDMTKSSDIFEDLNAYLTSRFSTLGDLKKEEIVDAVTRLRG